MAVGAGSIKRASKLSAEATTVKKESVDKAVVEQAAKQSETKTAPAKKTPAKKAPAKVTSAKVTTSTKAVKNVEAAVEPKKQMKVNQVCHLTEELPIYLL